MNQEENRFSPLLQDKAWEFVGFQGERPWTDFRGVGLLGLRQMVYFGTKHNEESRRMLSYCLQCGPLQCYSFSITGISITFDVIQWFRTRKSALFYYQFINDHDAEHSGLDAVHSLYCRAFVEFHQLWKSNPPETVMGYSQIHKTFIERMDVMFERNEMTVLD